LPFEPFGVTATCAGRSASALKGDVLGYRNFAK